MTTDQAKFILQGLPPGPGRCQCSQAAKMTLKLMEESEELQKWFKEEQAFDDAFADKLSDMHIPQDLTGQILSQVIEKSNKVVEFPWWKQFSVWGAAASILLVLGLVLLPSHKPLQESPISIANFQAIRKSGIEEW